MARRMIVVLIAAALSLASRDSQAGTAEESQAKGDKILREMSDAVAGMKTFGFTAVTDDVGDGSANSRHVVQHVVVRRPDGFRRLVEGNQGMNVWYDGKELTLVSDTKKIWARGAAPPTIDQAMDYVAAVYDLKLIWGDLLYSSPYEALTSTDTAGGWVGVEKIGGTECDHLSYTQPVVDWQIWITRGERRPKQLQITYKEDPGKPVSRVVFKDLDVSASVDEGTFAPKAPEGYTQLPLARRDSDLAPEKAEGGASSATAPAAPAPSNH